MDMVEVGLEPELADHFHVIWRRRWVILAVALAVALLLLLRPVGQVPFAATATVRFSVLRSTGQLEEETRFVARSYGRLATTPALLVSARTAAGLTMSDAELAARVRTRLDGIAGYVLVTADGPTMAEASALDQAVAQALVNTLEAEQVRSREAAAEPARAELAALDSQIASLAVGDARRTALDARRSSVQNELSSRLATAATLSAAVVVPAVADPQASSSRRRDAVLGFIVTAILAAEAAVWLRRVRSGLSLSEPEHEVSALLHVPCLALAPSNRVERQADLDRRLTTFFQRGLSRFPVLTVLEVPGRRWALPRIFHWPPPASIAARALARISVALDRRTLLVDASLGAPSLHQVLDLPRSPGLAEVLEGREDLLRAVHAAHDGSGLVVLAAGCAAAAPAAALRGQALRRLVHITQADTTVLSVNGESSSGVRDLVVAQSPDAIVLAGDPMRLSRGQLLAAADSVQAAGGRVVAVLLCRPPKGVWRRHARRTLADRAHGGGDDAESTELPGPAHLNGALVGATVDEHGRAAGVPLPLGRR